MAVWLCNGRHARHEFASLGIAAPENVLEPVAALKGPEAVEFIGGGATCVIKGVYLRVACWCRVQIYIGLEGDEE